jgi:putative aldouronate transport system substrate-binding protein
MKKVRLVKSTVAITLAAVMLAGCGGGSASSNSGGSGSGSEGGSGTGGGAAASGEEVTISVMVWDRGNAAPGTTPEDNTLTDYIKQNMKEKCNINVEYVSVPRSSSDDKVNIMMAGGNAPDIIFTYSQNLFNNFAQNGGLADLTAAYEANGENLKKNQGEIQSMGQYDGKQYAILKQRGLEMPRHLGFIRKDWLDAMGMEIPKTKEDLAAYLQAVKVLEPMIKCKKTPKKKCRFMAERKKKR